MTPPNQNPDAGEGKTPRTNEEIRAHDRTVPGFFYVPADFARQLERENARLLAANEAMRKDLREITAALNMPEADLTMTLAECVRALTAELAEAKRRGDRAIESHMETNRVVDSLEKQLSSATQQLAEAKAGRQLWCDRVDSDFARYQETLTALRSREAALVSAYSSALDKLDDMASAIDLALGEATAGQWTSVKDRFASATIAKLQAVTFGNSEDVARGRALLTPSAPAGEKTEHVPPAKDPRYIAIKTAIDAHSAASAQPVTNPICLSLDIWRALNALSAPAALSADKEADSARLDWLEANAVRLEAMDHFKEQSLKKWIVFQGHVVPERMMNTVRAAIDAARSATQGGTP